MMFALDVVYKMVCVMMLRRWQRCEVVVLVVSLNCWGRG